MNSKKNGGYRKAHKQAVYFSPNFPSLQTMQPMVSRRMRRIEKNVRLTSEQCVAHTDSQVGGDVGAEDLDEQQ